MISLAVSGVKEARARFQKASKAAKPEMLKAVEKAGYYYEGKMKKNRFSASATSRDAIRARTGQSRASITTQAKIVRGTPQAQVGTPMKHIEALEKGATIRPIKGKFLTIPIGPALTSGGSARARARDFPNTFVATSLKGQYLIFQKTGPLTCTPIFLLRKRVILPARKLFEKERQASDSAITKIAGGSVTAIVEIANGTKSA